MRFRKWPAPHAYEDTARKCAALFAKKRRDREALLRFASMIEAERHNVDEGMCGV